MRSTCDIHLLKDTVLKQSSLESSDRNIILSGFEQFTKLPTDHGKAMCSACAAQVSILSHEIKVVTSSA